MNPFYFFIIFLANCNAFTKISNRNNITPLKTFESIDNFSYTERSPIIKKINGFTKLIRPTNIIPTIFLGISSGFIMNPSFHELLKSKQFILSNAIVLLIMSNSMIINDLFDIHVDKKNNPSRPLVTGQIKKQEGIKFIAI
jgi:4-hydroxybenzoate polyprenyltransferase